MSETESHRGLLSVCIPAHNEQENIGKAIDHVAKVLKEHQIPHEFVIANDNSTDGTESVIRSKMEEGHRICLINRTKPGGFGRAIRSCLNNFSGEYVVIVMADLSDDALDIVKYYETLEQGYDAVFGSRFMKGSVVKDYPSTKLFFNRLGNHFIRLLFRTSHNDLTNAFKGFRAQAIRSIMPLYAAHFNITIEISLALVIRKFKIATVPINWYGRTWGQANFKIRELGRRYFATLFKLYAEWIFIKDDVLLEHRIYYLQVNSPTPAAEEVVRNYTNEKHIGNGGSGVRRV